MFDDQPNSNLPPANLPTEPVDIFDKVDNSHRTVNTSEDNIPDALAAGLLKKKENAAPTVVDSMPNTEASSTASVNNVASVYTMKEPILGKIIVLIIFVALLFGLGFAGWWFYTHYFVKQNGTINTGAITTTNQFTDVPQSAVEFLPAVAVTVSTSLPAVVNSSTARNDLDFSTTSIPTDIELRRDINNDKILFGEQIDTDKDGLDDVREKEIGTDPSKSDSDGDGLIDGEEVIRWKTNPLNADTDNDGYADGKEVYNGYNPLGAGKLKLFDTTTSTAK